MQETKREWIIVSWTHSEHTIQFLLEFKFHAQDEGTKKFLISKYFNFKMLDSKPRLAQLHMLQVYKLRTMNIDILESFQVGAIIVKLSYFWKIYRKKLLHNSEDFSLA